MMKTDKMYVKVLVAVSTLLNAYMFAGAQTVVYFEDCGVPSSNTLIQNYDGWQNATVLYTGNGTCDVRTSYGSSGYEQSSGGGNVMLNDTVKWFQISRLNTLEYSSLELHFGLRKTTSSDGSDLKIEVSADSLSWSRLLLVDTLHSGTGTSGWHWVHCVGLPSVGNLHIRFSNSGMSDFRLDDFMVLGVEEMLDTTDVPDNPDTTAILDYNQLSFSVFPNPTKNELNIHYGSLNIRTIKLYDLSGHLVMDLTANRPSRIYLGGFAPGVYVLKVVTDEGGFERKIVHYPR